ncbi:MAG: nucleotidyltransferase family protein [Chloroflexi bacterium]|nr:nucleotidyltransferase family protein [Chloroflexota bacterium]
MQEKVSVSDFQSKLRASLPDLQKKYGVRGLWVFGSRLRGNARPDSDLDVLVEFDDRPLSLLKFVEIENRLSDLLGIKVDLVEKKALKPLIGRRILQEAVAV